MKFYSHLTENYKLSSYQFGFRSGLSSENAINSMLSRLYEAMDIREYSVCTMISLSKAFDTLDRCMLLWRHEYYGVCNNAFLVKIIPLWTLKGIASNCNEVDLGGAQWSSLVPLLFSKFFNDSTQSTSFFISFYMLTIQALLILHKIFTIW